MRDGFKNGSISRREGFDHATDCWAGLCRDRTRMNSLELFLQRREGKRGRRTRVWPQISSTDAFVDQRSGNTPERGRSLADDGLALPDLGGSYSRMMPCPASAEEVMKQW